MPALDSLKPLILDLLERIATRPRPYSEVMDAWRTSCPKLPVWDDANDRGFIVQWHVGDHEPIVEVTGLGRKFLQENGWLTAKA